LDESPGEIPEMRLSPWSGIAQDHLAELAFLISLSPAERAALGARARNRVAEYFEIGHIVRQYENFYAGL
jgi:hypothetical protein